MLWAIIALIDDIAYREFTSAGCGIGIGIVVIVIIVVVIAIAIMHMKDIGSLVCYMRMLWKGIRGGKMGNR